jgi:hypothetical protein
MLCYLITVSIILVNYPTSVWPKEQYVDFKICILHHLLFGDEIKGSEMEHLACMRDMQYNTIQYMQNAYRKLEETTWGT